MKTKKFKIEIEVETSAKMTADDFTLRSSDVIDGYELTRDGDRLGDVTNTFRILNAFRTKTTEVKRIKKSGKRHYFVQLNEQSEQNGEREHSHNILITVGAKQDIGKKINTVMKKWYDDGRSGRKESEGVYSHLFGTVTVSLDRYYSISAEQYEALKSFITEL